jgi:serine/threonine-protein kinase HipA
MTDSLVVLLNNITVGTLSRMRENRLAFEYDDEYRNRREATPLSVSMPLQIRSHFNHLITP